MNQDPIGVISNLSKIRRKHGKSETTLETLAEKLIPKYLPLLW